MNHRLTEIEFVMLLDLFITYFTNRWIKSFIYITIWDHNFKIKEKTNFVYVYARYIFIHMWFGLKYLLAHARIILVNNFFFEKNDIIYSLELFFFCIRDHFLLLVLLRAEISISLFPRGIVDIFFHIQYLKFAITIISYIK